MAEDKYENVHETCSKLFLYFMIISVCDIKQCVDGNILSIFGVDSSGHDSVWAKTTSCYTDLMLEKLRRMKTYNPCFI